jgi:oxygen-independent coproporphyrinogen-3 oxidase
VTQGGGKLATQQRRAPEAWLAAIEERGSGLDEMTPIPRDAAIEEMLMMGLRLTEGVSRARLEALAERSIEDLFKPALSRLIEGGFVTLTHECLVATAAGRQRLNAVLGALLA